MRNIMAIGAVAVSILAASAQTPADSVACDSVKGFGFVDQVVVPCTPVKDQNKSGTCWCFTGISFLEHEILRQTGDTLDLSEMFVVRHCYQDKADRYVRMYGESNFAPGGSALDVTYVLTRYGLVPEEAYPGIEYGEAKHVHGEMDGILRHLVDVVVSKPAKKVFPVWRKAFDGVLDAYLGVPPTEFVYKGKTYTPQSFAASLGVKADDYVAVTSYTHHPFYEPFVLEIADNWLWERYINVPMEQMEAIVDNALANGYSVAWAADVSEPGFKWTQGYALMPAEVNQSSLEGTELARWVKLSDKDRDAERYNFDGPVDEIDVTQELRQQMFDSQETTDDHAMMIVGIAVDRLGNKYYKVKNSWDTNNEYGGYFYASRAYFLAKTLNVYVNKQAVPRDIARQMGLMQKK